MIGSVVENLSNKKLSAILALLFVLQLLFFLLGAIFTPNPSTSMEFLMSRCRDAHAGTTNKWISRENCEQIRNLESYHSSSSDARDIVFVAQMPHRRSGVSLEYSPWFQYLLGFLDVEILYNPDLIIDEKTALELEVRLAYKQKQLPPSSRNDESQWKELVSSTVQRTLTCRIDHDKKNLGYAYNCSTIDLFELGSNPYPFYLLNIRIPRNESLCKRNSKAPNCALGLIHDLRLIAVHQNGGFTFICIFGLWMKTFITPIVALLLYWFNQRVQLLNRPKLLLEKAILALGVVLFVMDFPIEWFSLWRPLSVLLVISDIRQGLFYAALFSFWLIFAGEHMIDDQTRNNLKNYWQNLSLVLAASLALLIYDVSERSIQLFDPFYSIWSEEQGHPLLAITAIVFAIFAALAYFAFLAQKCWSVWNGIRAKREAQLYRLSEQRRLSVESVIFRFKFLMVLTLVCAAATILSYAIQQYEEGHPSLVSHPSFLSGEGDDGSDELPYSSPWFAHSASAFCTGTFGMWNIYVLLLLSMYAPSHKHYTTSHVLQNESDPMMMQELNSGERTLGSADTAEEVTVTESSAMLSFFKSATD